MDEDGRDYEYEGIWFELMLPLRWFLFQMANVLSEIGCDLDSGSPLAWEKWSVCGGRRFACVPVKPCAARKPIPVLGLDSALSRCFNCYGDDVPIMQGEKQRRIAFVTSSMNDVCSQ